MKHSRTIRIGLLVVLALTMMLLSACVTGPSDSTSLKMQPSASFLICLAKEYSAGICGPCTREVVKDWITQNEPIEE